MTKLFSSRLIALTGIVLCIAVLSACKKKDEASSSQVQLLSFGPTGARVGDTIKFIGLNLSKVTAIQFTGTNAMVNQADFKSQDNNLIKVIVPAATEKGLVTLKTADGDIVTKTQFNISVTTSITAMNPKIGRPGENVTITGTYLNWVDRITFSKDKVVTNFVSKSQTQLVVKIPDDAETGIIDIHYAGTDSADIKTADSIKVKLPVATSFAPNPVFQNANVTITGTDLDLVKKVFFAGSSTAITTFVSQSATQLVVKVADAAMKGKVTLAPASGVLSVSSGDLDIVLPAVTGLSPNPVLHAGNLTITGTNLDIAKKVIFNNVGTPVTTFVSQSATQIVVKVPGGTTKGKVTLATNSGVTNPSAMDLDLVLPDVTNFNPAPADTGANVTLTGTNLDLVTSVGFVSGGTVQSANFVSQSATQIVLKVPGGSVKGKVILGVLNSTVTALSTAKLYFNGDPPPLADFPFPIYTDALQNTFQDWSYTASHDFNSTDIVREGDKSIKSVYGGDTYQGTTFHAGTGANTSAYTKLEFSVYGGAGTDGKKLNIIANGNYGNPPNVTITEGKWTTYSILLSALNTNVSTLNELVLQAGGFTGTLYIDHVGLR